MTSQAFHLSSSQGPRAGDVPDRAWRAIMNRDAGGDFVYGVSTTGIYCRPSCPSRQPRRNHVQVFVAAAEAEMAGYRPCKRCDPNLDAAPARAEALVRRACAYIDANPSGPVRLADIARAANASPGHLQRVFTRVLGISPRAYCEAKRESRLRHELRHGRPVGRAVYDAGYGSSRPVYGRVGSPLGMAPATYKKGGNGAMIRYAVIDAPIGRVLIAATERGLCSVRMGDDKAALVSELKNEFPAARIEHDEALIKKWVDDVRDVLNGSGEPSSIPLDVQATAFQRRVWEALRRIPSGETRSYSEIAGEIGSPHAARAVGRACATNPVAVIVPCHRVVRSGGGESNGATDSGYRWGIERKRALLEQERSRATAETPHETPHKGRRSASS
jgi:AraC family transcriptional regulator, regulatory protein of adaptative response / methylated-DNA-[protein]-cysteine methyltransferase